MYILPGTTYKLTFITGFEALDGIYTVLGLLSNAEMISLDVSVEDTYTALGKTADEWVVDKAGYLDYQFVKIQSVANETVIYYISEKMLAYIPDLSIKKYLNLSLVTNLGTFLSQDDIAGIELKIKNILTTDYGITNDPIVVSYSNSWLTDPEYLAIQTNRDSLRSSIVNSYSLQQEMAIENANLRAMVGSLEQMILPPSILSSHINADGDLLTITLSKTCIVAGGSFVLHGSINPIIVPTYDSGSNTLELKYTLSPVVKNGEVVTMDFTGPGISGPVPNGNLPNTLNLIVDNESIQP